MKILFLTPDCSPHEYGGGGVFARHMVDGLRKLGHEVDVVSTNLLTNTAVEKVIGVHGDEYYLEPIFPNLFNFVYKRATTLKIFGLYSNSARKILNKQLIDKNYDFIELFAHPGHIGLDILTLDYLKSHPNTKLFIHSHAVPGIFKKSIFTKLFYKFYLKLIASKLFNQAKFFSTISESSLQELRESGIEKDTHIITPGVEKPILESTPEEVKSKFGLKPNDKIIVSTGTITWHKNHSQTIEIFSELKKRLSDSQLKLVIVGKIGQPSVQSQLQDQVQKLGLQNDVIFTGFISNADRNALVSCAEMVWSSSLKEGFGMTLIEAMSFSRPVFVSKVEGHRDIIVHGQNGYFYEGKTALEISENILKKYSDKKLMSDLGQAANDFSESFHWANIINKYIEITKKYL